MLFRKLLGSKLKHMAEKGATRIDEGDVNPYASGRGKETLFRVAARNQIELIAIADNKANIVIGINVLLITVMIASLGSDMKIAGEPVLTKPEFVLPFITLTIFCLISAIFSIIAAKPKIIKPKGKSSTSKLFFQNFYKKSLDEYMSDMKVVLSSRENTYRQMIIDMYHNGIVLREKYDLLSKSYNVLMFGLVAAVLLFVGLIAFT